MGYVKTVLERVIEIDALITVHYFEYMKNFEFRGESHDFWEFLYVDKGTVDVCANTSWITLHAGDIIFHRPNEFHAIKSIGKDSPNLVAVSFTTSSPAMDFFIHKTFRLNKKERSFISTVIATARQTLATPLHIPSVEQVQLRSNTPFGSQQQILLYLELFLISLIQDRENSPVTTPSEKFLPIQKTTEEERLSEILKYMEFHICERLRVSDICNNFSISRSALQSLFHKHLGCGVMEHFNRMKMSRAKEIIRDGTMNMTEIACFLSYGSLAYFSRHFRIITGMSPSAYALSVKGISDSLGNNHDSGEF